ncbi:hypothetical protein C0J52_23817, partial [Blattella germanica]
TKQLKTYIEYKIWNEFSLKFPTSLESWFEHRILKCRNERCDRRKCRHVLPIRVWLSPPQATVVMFGKRAPASFVAECVLNTCDDGKESYNHKNRLFLLAQDGIPSSWTTTDHIKACLRIRSDGARTCFRGTWIISFTAGAMFPLTLTPTPLGRSHQNGRFCNTRNNSQESYPLSYRYTVTATVINEASGGYPVKFHEFYQKKSENVNFDHDYVNQRWGTEHYRLNVHFNSSHGLAQLRPRDID